MIYTLCAEEEPLEADAIVKTEKAKKETLPLWTADWNDEDIGEDFSVSLKREQQSIAQSGS